MIRHASIYDVKERAEQHGLLVLVMRHWPRGVRKDRTDVWLKEAGPSRELLDDYTHRGLAWAEFERRYRLEMLEQRSEILDRLRDLEREHGVLTLLCHERIPPADHCHREILADLLSSSARLARRRPGEPL
ncbi:MAG: DUF488 domain-containing protein [Chloroflexota bacterium]